MAVVFEAQGKLGEVLAQFKKEFLSNLQESDMNSEVYLQVRTLGDEEGASEEHSAWLKKQIIDAVEES